MRAAGMPLTRAVAEPFAITSGGPAQTQESPIRASGTALTWRQPLKPATAQHLMTLFIGNEHAPALRIETDFTDCFRRSRNIRWRGGRRAVAFWCERLCSLVLLRRAPLACCGGIVPRRSG